MTYQARPGDVYLLCSDGLTTMVREDRIASILAEAEDLEDAVSQLVKEANAAGGRDNITAVAFRLEEAEVPAKKDEDATLVGPAAAEAGLTPEAMASAAEARRAREPDGAGAGAPRRRVRTLAKIGIVLAISIALALAAVWGVRQIYFLGSDPGGRLALYRGLPYELPFDIKLYSEVYPAPVQVSSVPASRRDSATDHTLRSHDDAVNLLRDLEHAAEPPVKPRPRKQQRGTTNKQTNGGGKQGAQSGGGSGAGGKAPSNGGKA